MPSVKPLSKVSISRNGKTMYCNYKESHQAFKCKTYGGNKEAKAPWSLKEAKDKGTDFYDLGSVQKIKNKIPSKF